MQSLKNAEKKAKKQAKAAQHANGTAPMAPEVAALQMVRYNCG